MIVTDQSVNSESGSADSQLSVESVGSRNACRSVIVFCESLVSESSATEVIEVSDDSLGQQSIQLTDEDIREVEQMVEINDMIDNCYKIYESSATVVYHPLENNDKNFSLIEQTMLTELFQV